MFLSLGHHSESSESEEEGNPAYGSTHTFGIHVSPTDVASCVNHHSHDACRNTLSTIGGNPVSVVQPLMHFTQSEEHTCLPTPEEGSERDEKRDEGEVKEEEEEVDKDMGEGGQEENEEEFRWQGFNAEDQLEEANVQGEESKKSTDVGEAYLMGTMTEWAKEEEEEGVDHGDKDDIFNAEVSLIGNHCRVSVDSVQEGIEGFQADDWGTLSEGVSFTLGSTLLKIPQVLHDRLYEYQRQGVSWMWDLFNKGCGGILADEMGLGKTVQIAALFACLKFTEQASSFLVVAPVTLLQQWQREIKVWGADVGLDVHVFHGSPQERRMAMHDMAAKGGVLIVSMDLARTCIHLLRTTHSAASTTFMPRKRRRLSKRGCRDDDSSSDQEEPQPASGKDGPWDVVVIDEAHQLRNPSCLIGKALRKLESRSRFLLTGTPLQNTLTDVWALMDFAQPGLLGNHATFERNFSEQIAIGSKRNATRFAVELKDHLARELKRLTAPHFLRRLKTAVSVTGPTLEQGEFVGQLPHKTDVVLWLNLTKAQEQLYEVYLSSDIVRTARGVSKCGMEALRAIALLKKVCNHPLLCLPSNEFEAWRAATLLSQQEEPPSCVDFDKGNNLTDGNLAAEAQQALSRLQVSVPETPEEAVALSCKLCVLATLLPRLQAGGHRCLVFSQSTRMLDLIQGCVLRRLGLKFLRIDGTIDVKLRDLKVEKFQNSGSRYFCVCLSTQVGGVGLTLTAADRVILVDPAWNPAMDAQAIDRSHRIGQDRAVVVYRLIGASAIEDKMFRLQVFKRGVANTALEHEQQVRFFTHKELKQLFEPLDQSISTQSLMAELLGTEALEHEDLLKVVSADFGSPEDPEAAGFWQSADIQGFSDYQRLFMYLERAQKSENDVEEAEQHARSIAARLKNEEYIKDQVVEGSWRACEKENIPTQAALTDYI